MNCRNCPYGKEDFERYADFMDESDAETCIRCDKLDGMASLYEYCPENNIYEESLKKKTRKKKLNKRQRYLKHRNRMKHLELISCGYPKSCIYMDKVWIYGYGWVENPNPYYKRRYRGKMSKYLKKLAHRKVRRYKGDLSDGCGHHKLFDFWWELT